MQFKNNNTPFSGYNNPKPTADLFIKLLLLGDTGVGKSSLMVSYSEGEFPSNMVGTAGVDHKLKTLDHVCGMVLIRSLRTLLPFLLFVDTFKKHYLSLYSV